MSCKALEKTHPSYQAANAAEIAAVRQGVSNFPGVGCPPELRKQSQEKAKRNGLMPESLE